MSVSLNNVANAARTRGDLFDAERLFSESLELRRALARELGTPDARRDLSVSLNNVANASRARGDLAVAERLFVESCELRRALVLEMGTPKARRDLSLSLVELSTIADALQDKPRAVSLLREALSTVNEFETPQTLEAANDIIEVIHGMLNRLAAN